MVCGTALRRTCAVCHTDPLQNFLSSFITTTTFLTSHFFVIQRYPCVLARLSRVKKMLFAHFFSSAMSFCHRILTLAEPGSPFCLVYIKIQSAFPVSILLSTLGLVVKSELPIRKNGQETLLEHARAPGSIPGGCTTFLPSSQIISYAS